jgi:hypothetical protein
MARERGSYGEEEDNGGGGLAILFLFGITVGIYALSPGARHFYKHGRLPAPQKTGRWFR